MEIKEWKQLESSAYFVSNSGEIKRVAEGKETLLKQHKSPHGYLHLLLRINGRRKNFYVHRLVAIVFLNNADGKRCVNHKNGIKHDNRVENLEWVTYSENTIHAFNNNLSHRKPRNNKACVLIINGETIEFKSMKLAAEHLGCTRQYVTAICTGKQKSKKFEAYFEGDKP